MAYKWITARPGIRYREHEERTHGIGKDRYYAIRFQSNGKRKEEGLGWATEGWTLAKAEGLLAKFKEAARTGTGPTSFAEIQEEKERQEALNALTGTVEELFQGYVEDLKQRRKKSWPDVERVLFQREGSAAEFLGRETKARDVTPKQIMLYLRTYYERGSIGMADRVRVYLHSAFRFGIGNEYDYTRSNPEVSFGIESNPVSSIPKDKNSKKVGERHLTANELKTFMKALETSKVSDKIKHAITLIIYLGGQRVLEVLEAPKIEFDLDERIWTINKSRVKNDRTHILPISDRAAELIALRMSLSETHLLFPHENDPAKPFPNSSINRAVRRLCERNNIERFTPRDLRRTCRTLLADEGVPGYMLNKHFNHGDQGVGERHYDRSAHMKEKIEVMNTWNRLLDKWFEEPPSGGGSKVIKVNFGAKRAS